MISTSAHQRALNMQPARSDHVQNAAPRVLLYGDVDMNIIDGSSVWLQSTALALAAAGARVDVVLKAPVRTERLLAPLMKTAGIELRHVLASDAVAPDAPLSPKAFAHEADRALRADDADVVLVRGRAVADALVTRRVGVGRVWFYLTDISQELDTYFGDREQAWLERLAQHAQAILCQTEALRALIETAAPSACGRTFLTPPVVVPPGRTRGGTAPRQDLRAVYLGKFAPRWKTLEMCELPGASELGVPLDLRMVGDKIHRDPQDPAWTARMAEALRTSKGVTWLGGMEREQALVAAAGADVGLSWREGSLDYSRELSTKVLEYGAVGLPVILNRTTDHEILLGPDYPLFANSFDEVVEKLNATVQQKGVWSEARRRCLDASAAYSLESATTRFRRLLARHFPPSTPGRGLARQRVVVASHDLKFFTKIGEHLAATPEFDVEYDHWAALDEHDAERSAELLEHADTVICEWCGPNAIWYSHRVSDRQRLIVRLHRFEAYSNYPEQLDIDRVSQVVVVSEHYRTIVLERFGWDPAKVVVLPNWVDTDALYRGPKLPGSRHTLGFLGLAPWRKRFDLALDVLADLRSEDPRFRMLVKSKQPWEYWWIWRKAEEQEAASEAFSRLRHDPRLRGAVAFDRFGPDVGLWLQRIGFVLSTSDDESFHLAPAEGMASGAVPVIRDWPGAETIYDPPWIHGDVRGAVEAILAASTPEGHAAAADLARDDAAAFDVLKVLSSWRHFVAG